MRIQQIPANVPLPVLHYQDSTSPIKQRNQCQRLSANLEDFSHLPSSRTITDHRCLTKLRSYCAVRSLVGRFIGATAMVCTSYIFRSAETQHGLQFSSMTRFVTSLCWLDPRASSPPPSPYDRRVTGDKMQNRTCYWIESSTEKGPPVKGTPSKARQLLPRVDYGYGETLACGLRSVANSGKQWNASLRTERGERVKGEFSWFDSFFDENGVWKWWINLLWDECTCRSGLHELF